MPGVAARPVTKAPALEPCWQAKTEGHAISMAWSPGGSMIAVASADGGVALLSEDGRRHATLAGHAGGCSQVAWQNSAGGGLLATAGLDGLVRLWQPSNGREVAVLETGSGWTERTAWSRRGSFLATAAGRKLRLFDFRDAARPGQLLRDYPEQPSTIADIAWKPGAADLLTSCGYNGLNFWSPDQNEAVRHFAWKGSMLRLAWSPNGKYIATGNQDSTIQFWLVESGKELQMWGYRSKIRELAWDGKSRYLASGGSPVVVVWDCSGKGPAGSKPLMLDLHGSLLTQLAFQEEGTLLASGCQEGMVAIWRPGKENSALATEHLGSAITQLAWSPSGKRLAAATAEGNVAVFRAP
jgi:WD40 repeat protein